MAQKMPDWSDGPLDLLVSIGRCLNLIEDYLNFGCVCKSWHSVATKNNFNNDLSRAPWQMLAEEEDNEVRKFFSLYNGMILNKRIPKASRKRCLESMGWLITVGEEGCLLVCDVADVVGSELTKCHILAQIPTEPQDMPEHLYILESLGSLFVIVPYGVQLRLVQDDCDRIPLTVFPEGEIREDMVWEDITCGTTNFRVFQVDLAAVKMTETRELGDAKIFMKHTSPMKKEEAWTWGCST
ncbi:hypothetical protein KY290_018810 [Solanum tuberosum]|uniref:F-box domain-containing protein n=1 Tax=Solanum tuberosum TaxID=4113 RepID=A0ABQ7VF95_SOLTU|nr:hypothetical protein KY290_018810 [Solanum tuberosum]